MMTRHYVDAGYFDPFSFIIHVLIWVLVIWAICAILRGGRMRRMDWFKEYQHRDPGMEVLRERYAKGEITKEEFETKKKDLTA